MTTKPTTKKEKFIVSIEEFVDTVVARVLDPLGVDNNLVKQWTE